VVAIKQGKPRAELSLVLRTLSALGLFLSIDSDGRVPPSTDGIAPVDIDAVVEAAKGDGE